MQINNQNSCAEHLFNIVNYKFSIEDSDPLIKRITNLAIGTILFVGVAFLGSCEVVYRHTIVSVVKVIHFFIPKQDSEIFDDIIFYPIIEHAKSSLEFTLKAITHLFMGLFGITAIKTASKTIEQKIKDIYTSVYAITIIDIHFNGSRQLSLPYRIFTFILRIIEAVHTRGEKVQQLFVKKLNPFVFIR